MLCVACSCVVRVAHVCLTFCFFHLPNNWPDCSVNWQKRQLAMAEGLEKVAPVSMSYSCKTSLLTLRSYLFCKRWTPPSKPHSSSLFQEEESVRLLAQPAYTLSSKCIALISLHPSYMKQFQTPVLQQCHSHLWEELNKMLHSQEFYCGSKWLVFDETTTHTQTVNLVARGIVACCVCVHVCMWFVVKLTFR